ncbi:MAG: TadE family protein [Candidatus Dormibacteria bacterium]
MSPGGRRAEGQALVELALILPVILLLGCGAVGIVQLARTQMALGTAASATALVAARAADAASACRQAHLELALVLADSAGLLPAHLHDTLNGACVGSVPVASALPTAPGTGAYTIWFGYGAPGDTFCRAGGVPGSGGVTDGDVVVAVAFRPDLAWIPLLGSWLSPALRATTTDKIDPFRSRDPGQDQTGDNC